MKKLKSIPLLLFLFLMVFASESKATAPTLISYAEADWTTNGATSKATTLAVSWNSGDILVVVSGSETGVAPDIPTATGLTFTSQKSNAAANTCGTRVSTAVAGSTSSSIITVTYANINDVWGFAVWVWRGSVGVGNSSEQHTTTHSVPLTPAAVDSAIMWGTFDFNVGALGTITPTPTNTRQRVVVTSRYTIYVSDLGDQPSAGSVSYGLTGSGGGPFSTVAVEIKGSATTPTVQRRLAVSY